MDVLEQLKRIAGDRATAEPTELYCYSFDASQVRGTPDYVVLPKSASEVSEIMKLAAELSIPVTARGAGTGLAGGAVPVRGGIVLDMSSMRRIIEISPEDLQTIVEPGVVPDRLNQALKPYGFFFPPDPGSSAMCTIGGMISNNASGMRSVKYGTTRSYVLDIELVTADGEIIHTGSRVLKSSSGYDLTRLIAGAEGTLGVITRAGLKIAPLPKARRLVVASFESAESAGRGVARVLSMGVMPSACEILDRTTLKVLKRCDPNIPIPVEGDAILFEVEGVSESSVEDSSRLIEQSCDAVCITRASSQEEMDRIWSARKLVGAAVSLIDPMKSRIYVGEDVGVPISRIPAMIKKVEEISKDSGIPAMKFGHIGDGNLHVALFIDVSDRDSWSRLGLAADRIHRAAIELGGTVSSEHGIGLARAMYMESQLGKGLDVMRDIKKALDPRGLLNPGKLGL